MPRKPRLFLPRATYHVYCRVARGESVFGDVNEATEFVETARHVRDLDGWKILAWCLGNHYHLVVATDTVPLFSKTDHLSRDGSTPACTCNTAIPSSGIASIHSTIRLPRPIPTMQQ